MRSFFVSLKKKDSALSDTYFTASSKAPKNEVREPNYYYKNSNNDVKKDNFYHHAYPNAEILSKPSRAHHVAHTSNPKPYLHPNYPTQDLVYAQKPPLYKQQQQPPPQSQYHQTVTIPPPNLDATHYYTKNSVNGEIVYFDSRGQLLLHPSKHVMHAASTVPFDTFPMYQQAPPSLITNAANLVGKSTSPIISGAATVSTSTSNSSKTISDPAASKHQLVYNPATALLTNVNIQQPPHLLNPNAQTALHSDAAPPVSPPGSNTTTSSQKK